MFHDKIKLYSETKSWFKMQELVENNKSENKIITTFQANLKGNFWIKMGGN